MKTKLFAAMLSIILAFLFSACSKEAPYEPASGEADTSTEVSKTDENLQKDWMFDGAKRIRFTMPTSGYEKESPYSLLQDGRYAQIKKLGDGESYLHPTLVENEITDTDASTLNGKKACFAYLTAGYIYRDNPYKPLDDALTMFRYQIALTADDGIRYRATVGLLPEDYRGLTADELIMQKTDYFERFDMNTETVVLAGNEIEYVYRNYIEEHKLTENISEYDIPAFAVAVFNKKWIVVSQPTEEGFKDAAPQNVFREIVFEERRFEDEDIGITRYVTRYENGTVVKQSDRQATADDPRDELFEVFNAEGEKLNSFTAEVFRKDMNDRDGNTWLVEKDDTLLYCNYKGELYGKMNSAESLLTYDRSSGTYIGVLDGELTFFQSGEPSKVSSSICQPIMTRNGIEAVKLGSSFYAVIKDGKALGLYDTAVEYRHEYDSFFVGGDVVLEIINRNGEKVEAFCYNYIESDPTDGKYLLAHTSMSLSGNSFVLDAKTMKVLAYLPAAVDYEFTKDGKIKVSYNDHENDNEYVEFTVTPEQAIKNYSEYYEEDCGCFTGYPAKEDFE